MDGIEGFGNVHRDDGGSTRRLPIVESLGRQISHRKEGSSGGVERTKTVLIRRKFKSRYTRRKEETLKHFNARRQQGNRTIRRADSGWLSRLGNGNDDSVFPDCRNVGLAHGQVEEVR